MEGQGYTRTTNCRQFGHIDILNHSIVIPIGYSDSVCIQSTDTVPTFRRNRQALTACTHSVIDCQKRAPIIVRPRTRDRR